MKRLILLLMSLTLVFVLADGQRLNKTVANDTIKGADVTFSLGYDVNKYNGIAGFQFTADTVTGKADKVILQGSYNEVTWINIDSVTNVGNGTSFLSDTPPAYKNYRLYGDGSAGDTIVFKNIRAIYKQE